MSSSDSPRRLERYDLPPRLAQAVLFGIGGLLAGLYVYDLVVEWGQPSYPFWLSLLENGPGLGLSGAILVLTGRLSTTRRPPIYFSETAKGCLTGFVSALGVGLFLLALRQIRGEGAPMVYLLATVGAFSGTVVGYVQARRGRIRERLRSIAENLSEGIYRSAPGEGIVYANQAFAEMFGYGSPEALFQVDPAILYADPSERERIQDQSHEQGGLDGVEVELRRRDGSTFTGLLSGTVVRGEEGDVKYYDGAIADVTDRKEAERALREERDRFETLFESLPTPVVRCQVREDGNIIIDANEAFEAVFGVEASVAEGKDIDELIVPADRREEAAEIAQRALEKGSMQAEVRRKTADGLRDFQLQIAGRAPAEAPPEVYIIYTDITEQKEQERRLKEAKQEAEEANRVKSAFLANMSHEIRTPLTSIIGFAEAIGEETSGEEGMVSRFADRIHKGGQRLLETLDAVLNLSKLEAGEMRLAREPVDLTEEAEAVAEELHPRAEEAGVDLAVESPDSPVRAEADEGGVQITVQNLVTNAIKYTESGGRVRIRTYREKGQAMVEVEDTGIGMDPEVAEALFEPFRQATGGPGRVYEGTGVGLAITKRAVEQMKGHIEVDTEKGEGSRFTVRLPRCENSGEA